MQLLNFANAKSVVVSLSGGIDSYVCALAAIQQGVRVSLFHSKFNKPVSLNELAAAKRLAAITGANVEIADFSHLADIQLGYLPLAAIAGEWDAIKEFAQDQPASGFHVVMSTVAYYAQISGHDGAAFGLTKEQTEGRNVAEGLRNLESMVRNFSPKAKPVSIIAPLLELSKAEVIAIGQKLNVPFDKTWSCASPLGRSLNHCGSCPQCLNRKAAFGDARIKDPTIYG